MTDGVASVVKHWVGYSAAVDGYDAHNYYGRKSDLNAETFELHAKAFKGAFDANVAGVMPSYSVLENLTVDGKKVEEIGGGFSKVLLTDLLKEREGFDGFVLTDWLTLGDCPKNCSDPTQDNPQTPMDIGMPWGLIDKSVGERVATALGAGVDQFGGFESPLLVLEMIEDGAVTEDRIEVSARKILTLKFQLGLFENPYVDAEKADSIVRDEVSHQNGFEAQKKAQVLLKNEEQTLPLSISNQKLWLVGVDKEVARRKGLQLADNVENADIIVMRVETPTERIHPYHFFAQFQKEGRMDYTVGNPDYDFISSIPSSQKVVVAVDMDRAAVLANLMDKSDAVISVFGATDSALLDVIIGETEPQGRLPFNLPSSWEAVQAQNPGRPDDDVDPLFAKGFGLGDN